MNALPPACRHSNNLLQYWPPHHRPPQIRTLTFSALSASSRSSFFFLISKRRNMSWYSDPSCSHTHTRQYHECSALSARSQQTRDRSSSCPRNTTYVALVVVLDEVLADRFAQRKDHRHAHVLLDLFGQQRHDLLVLCVAQSLVQQHVDLQYAAHAPRGEVLTRSFRPSGLQYRSSSYLGLHVRVRGWNHALKRQRHCTHTHTHTNKPVLVSSLTVKGGCRTRTVVVLPVLVRHDVHLVRERLVREL